MLNVATRPTESVTPIADRQHSFTLEDGTRLFYRSWIPAGTVSKTLVVLHRGHEHSGRLVDVIEELGLEDTAVFAWDARGHGNSEGQRGYAPSFMTLVSDLDQFARHICTSYDLTTSSMSVLGHSVGGVVATTWVHDYNPGIRALILATPAFRVRLYVPFAIKGLRAMRLFAGRRSLFISSYVRGRMLTTDENAARSYDEDRLVSRAIGVDVLLDLRRTADRLLEDAHAIRTPTLVLAGSSDAVVDLDTERGFYNRLGATNKKMVTFPGMRHDILHERERHLVLAEIRSFLASTEREASTNSGEVTNTRTFERLSTPLSWLDPGRAWFAAQKTFLRTVGRLSQGIRLGWDRGFDSGAMLDYVYENKASGITPLGQLIDRIYLDSPGWRGIRQRREAAVELLDEALVSAATNLGKAHVVDVACGKGRYVLDTLEALPRGSATAHLCDFDPENVRAALMGAHVRGLQGVTGQQIDAFDVHAVAALSPRPTVGIVSGLFELFHDNDQIRRALAGLGQAIPSGGYLVYTGQPWHPQVEMIARVLTNRDGVPWVMRCRSQSELDTLVREAGFEKIRTVVDDRGIFTVSIARRSK